MIFSQRHMENFRLQIADRLLRDSTCRNHGTALKNPLAERPTTPTTDKAPETKDTTPRTPSTQIRIPTFFQIGYSTKNLKHLYKPRKQRKSTKNTPKPTSKRPKKTHKNNYTRRGPSRIYTHGQTRGKARGP
jgi:hypothetical protein